MDSNGKKRYLQWEVGIMRFTKKFVLGGILEFVGILTAFNNVSDYRTAAIILFWLGMLSGLAGLFLMFKGIKIKNHVSE